MCAPLIQCYHYHELWLYQKENDAYYFDFHFKLIFQVPEIDYDFETNKGSRAFNYFSFGVACSEVKLDTLTGESQILRSDILMDVGASLNPAIDIGQIEGALLRGL